MDVSQRFCPICGSPLIEGTCSSCGPASSSTRGKSVVHELFDEIAFADRRVVGTVRDLLGHPGRLTVAWEKEGKGPYVGPVRLFIACALAYVLMIGLGPQTSGFFHGAVEVARDLVATFLDSAGLGTTSFLARTAAGVKSLGRLLDNHLELALGAISVPLAAVTARLLFRGRRRPWSLHLVFSLHLHAFALVVGFVVTVIVWLGALPSAWVEDVAELLMAAYAGLAAGSVYELHRREIITGGITYVFAYGLGMSVVLSVALMLMYAFGA